MSNIEGRITLAIQAYKSGYFKSLRAVACLYDILYITLINRYHSTPSQCDSRSILRKLISIKEEVLIQYILNLNA